MEIRKINTDDAEDFLNLNKKLDTETQFLLFEPNERQTTVSEQKQIIGNFESNGVIVFVLENDGELIGFVGGTRQKLLRKKHCLGSAIGILQKYTNQGYGKKLLNEIEIWAIENGIYRIELTVRADNNNAIDFYKKSDF